jgi:hypothetical protein
MVIPGGDGDEIRVMRVISGPSPHATMNRRSDAHAVRIITAMAIKSGVRRRHVSNRHHRSGSHDGAVDSNPGCTRTAAI